MLFITFWVNKVVCKEIDEVKHGKNNCTLLVCTFHIESASYEENIRHLYLMKESSCNLMQRQANEIH